ncbi:MAG: Ankyrin repeat and SOCS box protein 3, partial [Paramarteilia canceri]
ENSVLSASIISNNVVLCSKLLLTNGFSESDLEKAISTASQYNNIQCLCLLSGIIFDKWLKIINDLDVAKLITTDSKTEFCRFLAQRGLNIAKTDENNMNLMSNLKQSVSKSVLKDVKRSELFYKKNLQENFELDSDEQREPEKMFNSKFFKIKLYDLIYLKISSSKITDKKYCTEDLSAAIFEDLEISEFYRQKLEDSIREIVSDDLAEDRALEEEKITLLSIPEFFQRISKNIGKSYTIQAFAEKKVKDKNTKQGKKSSKSLKLKPSKLKESYKLEICLNNDCSAKLPVEETENIFKFKVRPNTIYSITDQVEKKFKDIFVENDFLMSKTKSNAKQNSAALVEITRFGDEQKLAAYLLSAQRTTSARNISSKYGKTILHEAARNGDAKLCKQLVLKNFPLEIPDNFLWLPIHHACFKGHLSTVRVLTENISELAALKSSTVADSDCLHLAVISGNLELIQYLVEECGFDPEKENLAGKTAVSLAKEFQEFNKSKTSDNKMVDEGQQQQNIYDYLQTYLESRKDKTKKKTDRNSLAQSKVKIAKNGNFNLTNYESQLQSAIERGTKSKFINLDFDQSVEALEISAEEIFQKI